MQQMSATAAMDENDYVARHAPRERGEAEREGSLGDKRVEEREMCIPRAAPNWYVLGVL
jgi:hypothetical protein